MESYGAHCVYVTDSAGYMLPDDVTARIGALRDGLKTQTQIGFHGHHNLAMGIANSLAAIDAGAIRIDGSVAGLGAGAGNTPLEVFCAVCDRMGIETGVDVFKLTHVAEDQVVPLMDHPIRIDRDSLMLGYAGVYSSFLLHAQRASKKYGVPSHEILLELGRRRTVGGQEDMIEDLALEMVKEKESENVA
jgi:4-hydroxy-2-oxovalerate/4-hydroxy-2-oxohexanoate aldolase